jgi:phosphohistidine phosphatase
MLAYTPSPEPILQACIVPYRQRGDQIEFCLITSLKKRNWIFPKGIIDPGETLEQTALKESQEEAGLRGRILSEPLGTYEDFKWGTTLLVTVILLEVTHCDDEWPEMDVRARRWVAAEQAADLLSKENLRRFAHAAIRRITDRARGEQE